MLQTEQISNRDRGAAITEKRKTTTKNKKIITASLVSLFVMTNANGTIRTATSTAFGFYRFADVAAGETYIFTAQGKRFAFTEPTQVLSVLGDLTDLNFIAADDEDILN